MVTAAAVAVDTAVAVDIAKLSVKGTEQGSPQRLPLRFAIGAQHFVVSH